MRVPNCVLINFVLPRKEIATGTRCSEGRYSTEKSSQVGIVKGHVPGINNSFHRKAGERERHVKPVGVSKDCVFT